mgnify:CR=1 FL=1
MEKVRDSPDRPISLRRIRTQAEWKVAEAWADLAALVGAAIQVGFGAGLQDQALGQQQVVFGAQAQGALAAFAEEGGGFGFQAVERCALEAEGGPGLGRAGFEVLAQP